MLKIRNAGTEDIPLIRQLAEAIWPDAYSAIISKEQLEYMLDLMYSDASLQKQFADGCRFIIAMDDDTPVGFASFQDIDPPVWKLHKLYILTQQQGKGTGRFLIGHIVDTIRPLGAKRLELQVNKQNKAYFFYLKYGFTVQKELVLELEHGFVMDDYVLELRIDNG